MTLPKLIVCFLCFFLSINDAEFKIIKNSGVYLLIIALSPFYLCFPYKEYKLISFAILTALVVLFGVQLKNFIGMADLKILCILGLSFGLIDAIKIFIVSIIMTFPIAVFILLSKLNKKAEYPKPDIPLMPFITLSLFCFLY